MASALTVERSRAAWWGVAAVLTAVVGFVLYSFVGTFVFGVFIYYGTRPVYRRLKRWLRPPSLAAGVALLVLAAPVLLLLIYTVSVALTEYRVLAERYDFTQFNDVLGRYVDVATLLENPQRFLEEPTTVQALQAFLQEASDYLAFLGNGALHFFVMLGIAFYLLRDDHRLARWFRQRFSDSEGALVAYGRAVDRDFSNIFFGNLLNAVLTAIIGAVAYNLLNAVAPASVSVPYATLLGLLAGAASLIPVVGMKLVYVPVALYLTARAAFLDPSLFWFPAVFALVSFVIVDSIPDFVLRPYVSGRGLHLGMVMFAYIFGPLLWGWYGIFLGPMALVLVVHFTRIVLPELIAGDEIQGAAVGHRYGPEPAGATPVDGGTADRDAADAAGGGEATPEAEVSESGDAPGGEATDEGSGDRRSESSGAGGNPG